jgi:adenylate cyclase
MPAMKRILIILLTITGSLFTISGSAQLQGQAKIDSLLKEPTGQKDDTNRVKRLNYAAFIYSGINPDEGIKYAKQGLALATQLGYKMGMAMTYDCIGTNYRHKSDEKTAIEYYEKAIRVLEEIGKKKAVRTVLGNIGNVYSDQSNYSKAMEYYLKSLVICEELNDDKGKALAYGNLGNVYEALGEYAKAIEYDQKSLNIYEKDGNRDGMLTAKGNIGNIYGTQKNYTKALEYYFEAIKISEEINSKHGTGLNCGNVSIAYLKLGNYTAAIEYAWIALKINEETGYKRGVGFNLECLGDIYLTLVTDTAGKNNESWRNVNFRNETAIQKYKPDGAIPVSRAAKLHKAIEYLEQAIVIGKEINSPEILQPAFEKLSIAYKLSGNFDKALDALGKYYTLKDSVFSKENRDKVTRMEEVRNQFVDSLKIAEVKREESRKATNRRNFELMGGGVLFLALAFIFILKKNNKLLDRERKQSDNLLLNILPEEVAAQLKDTGKSAAKQFDNITVMFTDFVNFTEASERMAPAALVEELDTCFREFDDITSRYNVEKIKTIGDAYLAVCGLPTPDPKHAENVVLAAREINAFMADRLAKLGSERTFAIRIGIHSGSVVAGIVGVKKFAYDIWGDTVNTAARMEQNSEAGKINISQCTYELVKDKFTCEFRGEVEAKGKGAMSMYYISTEA